MHQKQNNMSVKFPIFFDSLYGFIDFNKNITQLLTTPVIQRLRHVRLSNIDSVSMPGISALTRFEHVIGVANLASKVGFYASLSREDQVTIQASALLHDWAITAFGHLVEEAFSYLGTNFDHEDKLYQIVINEDSSEIGGIDRQIFCGRETGLRKWATRVSGEETSEELIKQITKCIAGNGKFGRIVCGDIDLDNIDNVVRMGFHMGLDVDRELPNRLVSSIIGVEQTKRAPIFLKSSIEDIVKWLELRSQVYEKLMLAKPDFSAKLMLLWSVIVAYQNNEISSSDWNLTDYELIQRLQISQKKECQETVNRFLVGELWDISKLFWMEGKRPNFDKMLSFSNELSSQIGRQCFAYCIKDKRNRRLEVHFDDQSCQVFGDDPNQWLLGIGSNKKKPFSDQENNIIIETAETYFDTKFKEEAISFFQSANPEPEQFCLFQ